MINTIDLIDDQKMQVTWDLNRRCNYDCSYCPSHRHDNWSPFPDLDVLKKTASFVLDYCNTLVSYKKSNNKDHQRLSISFTGGEPTMNPHFLEFAHFIGEEKKKFIGNYAGIALTTNGQYSTIMAKNIVNNFDFATISYHAEALPKQKKKVLENIKFMHSYGFDLKVNVMFHASYWDECIEVCLYLDDLEIDYHPRLIGEQEVNASVAHKYTQEQLTWIKQFWDKKNNKLNERYNIKNSKVSAKKKFARQVGRPCCGGRSLCVTNDDGTEEKATFIGPDTKFRDWYCSINWFFLHIDTQTETIWHHQTCKARFDGTRGPIGKIDDTDKILNELKENLENKTMPIMVCPLEPGQHCGCGLCTPKSKDLFKFKKVLSNHIEDMSIFNM